ncbi:MAG: methyltransferase domain-containing protein, partial [Patescibacteria group bacterium]|nr:methyltransferase domain-containing protein [Patescibacteria group bacterium]
VNKIKQGEIWWNCHTQEKFDRYLQNIDALFHDIQTKGYLLSTDQSKRIEVYNGKEDKIYERYDEVLISIGRDGHSIFHDGAHRLSIAKILRLPKIPVMILMRHKNWVEFRNKLLSYSKILGGKLYQMAYHYDLDDIPAEYGQERFDLIKNNLSVIKGSLLDIGANLGYFCHKFEELGFTCDAIEINPQDVFFMQKLKLANEDKFSIFLGSIFDYKKNEKLKYDIVLALNIFHHFLKRRSTYYQLIELLKRLDCQELFFQTHDPKEKQMAGAFKNYSSREFVEFIIQHSCLTHYSLIKTFDDGRKLYKLQR